MDHGMHSVQDEQRFSFGLTTQQVERLQRILSRLEGRAVPMDEAWGRAAELMALAKTMLEVLATHPPEDDISPSSKVDPGGLLTDRGQPIN